MEGKTFTISAKRFDEERFRLFFQCSYSQKYICKNCYLKKAIGHECFQKFFDLKVYQLLRKMDFEVISFSMKNGKLKNIYISRYLFLGTNRR